MAYKTINHDVRVVNGRTIYMPSYFDNQTGLGNLELPDLSVADSTQKYPLGTKYVDGERVWKYALFGGTVNPDLGAHNTQYQPVGYSAIAAATAQYATQLTFTLSASDGHAADGAIAADELAGGYCVIFDASSKAIKRQIQSNAAVAAGGGTMTLDLTDPIPVALTTSDHIECIANPYRNVTASTSNSYGVVGIPELVYTSGQYGWLQTWGPCWVAPQAAVGSGSNNDICIFRHDGSIDELDYSAATNNKGQIAGYVMCWPAAGTQGAPFVFLQISN